MSDSADIETGGYSGHSDPSGLCRPRKLILEKAKRDCRTPLTDDGVIIDKRSFAGKLALTAGRMRIMAFHQGCQVIFFYLVPTNAASLYLLNTPIPQ